MAREYRNWRRNTYHCTDCKREMRPEKTPPDGRALYGANGCCNACATRKRERFEPVTWPTRTMDRDLLLTEYEWLRLDGVPPGQMPRRLSMTPVAFEKAMYRARRAGDPRAMTWRGLATTGRAA